MDAYEQNYALAEQEMDALTYCDNGACSWCTDPMCPCDCHEQQHYDDDAEKWVNNP